MVGPDAGSRTRRRDTALRAELVDCLQHDVRTRHLSLDVRVDGGVAHIQGEVENEAGRAVVARLARRVDGIHAVWDFIGLPGRQPRVLDVGCGATKQLPWAIGVDRVPSPGVDLVADLEKGLPLPENSVDHVLAIHVLEHIENLLELMDEVHRVLSPTGTLHVMTPDWRASTSVADPTHRRYMHTQTFKYFCEPHGQRLWQPLKAGSDGDTVYADLTPSGGCEGRTAPDLARWFL